MPSPPPYSSDVCDCLPYVAPYEAPVVTATYSKAHAVADTTAWTRARKGAMKVCVAKRAYDVDVATTQAAEVYIAAGARGGLVPALVFDYLFPIPAGLVQM